MSREDGSQSRAARRGVESELDDFLLEDPPADEPIRKRRNRRAFRIMAAILGFVLVALAALVGYYVKVTNDALSGVQREPMLPSSDVSRPPSATPQEGKAAPVNLVLMGSDSRGEGDRGRSDVLMLAHISGDRKTVYLISLPRDLWVEIPGHGMAKINAAYAYGGMPLTIQTIETLLNVRMDHSAVVDFDGFVAAIDAVGGVDVYNFVASGSNGYVFPEGMIHLDGEAGLVYTRERYNLPNGDLDRARRQRDVVMAVTRKILTPEVLADPGQFNQVVSTLAPYFSVDEAFTNSAMTKLALSMRITGGDGLRSLQAPIQGFGTSEDGQSINIVHVPFMTELGNAMQTDTMDAYYQAHKDDPPVKNP